jgi:hypothetical protein
VQASPIPRGSHAPAPSSLDRVSHSKTLNCTRGPYPDSNAVGVLATVVVCDAAGYHVTIALLCMVRLMLLSISTGWACLACPGRNRAGQGTGQQADAYPVGDSAAGRLAV